MNHAYDELVLVAAPRFLGLLGDTIGHEVSKLLVKSIGKGITRSTPEQIRIVVDAEPLNTTANVPPGGGPLLFVVPERSARVPPT